MFAGAIKRDRAPFVLSEDMAYVINHGDKTGRSFHHFVDKCTQGKRHRRCWVETD